MNSRHFINKKQAAFSKLHSLISQVTTINNVEKCPICIETMMDKAQLDGCQHEFCYACIVRWSKIVPACPLCKATCTRATSGKNVFIVPPKVTTESEDDEDEEEDDDDDDDDDDEEDAQQLEVQLLERNFGYDSDDGFVVDEETLEYDSGNENNEVDAILDHADALLLRQRKRKRKQRRQNGDHDDGDREEQQSLLPQTSISNLRSERQVHDETEDDDVIPCTTGTDDKSTSTANKIITSIQFLQQFEFRSNDNYSNNSS